MERALILAMFFGSGFAALVYQVLWLRQLHQLFGNTAYAASTTLLIFFLGLAIGSWLLGRRSARIRRPLRAYAGIEVGIAIASASYFLLLHRYRDLYGALFTQLHDLPAAFLATKAVLAVTMLLPAAILMGGTLPVIGQHLVRRAEQLATTTTLLYAGNTLGAACGAFATGFFLPHIFGYRGSYLAAMSINLTIAAGAFGLDRRLPDEGRHVEPEPSPRPVASASRSEALPWTPGVFYGVAFLSGFATLSLEVFWTRMFAQVLHNSVYSFAAILVVFLTALALGSAVSHRLCRGRSLQGLTLIALLTLAGFSVVAVPFLFHLVTANLSYVAAEAGWGWYILSVFATAISVLLIPVVLMGTVFPYIWKAAESFGGTAGQVIGATLAVNTVGSIVGAALAGFVLLPWLGLWAGIKTMGLLYLAAAILLGQSQPATPARWRVIPVMGLLLFATVFDSARLGIVRTDPKFREIVYDSWQGPHGIVAVVQRGGDLRIKVDNYYSLGGTNAVTYERTQADLPLVLHGNARSAFFLGLGTGITAGAAIEHPLERITVAELIPEVVEASRNYFQRFTNGLFDDKRVRVIVDDGRNYLRGTDEQYDVVVADLFIPWQSGAAEMYTAEHFAAVRDRLRSGGLFAQWVPLYQLSRDEFFVIARTMTEVFPQVTLWRGDFEPTRPIVALIGHKDVGALDVGAVVESFRRRKGGTSADRREAMATTALFYVGNLSADRPRYASYVVNTDDWPVIEYSAPITQREVRGHGARWFVGNQLDEYYASLSQSLPPRRDPYLTGLTDEEIGFVEAGRNLFASKVSRQLGNDSLADSQFAAYTARMPDDRTSRPESASHQTEVDPSERNLSK